MTLKPALAYQEAIKMTGKRVIYALIPPYSFITDIYYWSEVLYIGRVQESRENERERERERDLFAK